MRKLLLSIGFSLLITVDLVSKYYAQRYLGSENINCIGDLISLRLSYNTGVAFSLPLHSLLLQGITILLILGMLYQYIHVEYSKKSRLLDTGYMFIVAGALSHAYERIFIGYVVDFIAVKYFAILNFADIFISVGVLLILLAYVRIRKFS